MSVVGTCILYIIIGKLHNWEKPSSVVLMVVDKDLEVGLHCTILLFCLPVCLGMKYGRKFLLDV